MSALDLIKLANDLRKDYGAVAYFSINKEEVDGSVNILTNLEANTLISVTSKEEIPKDIVYAQGQESVSLLTEVIQDISKESSESTSENVNNVVLLVFVDEFTRATNIGGVYVQDNVIHAFNSEMKTINEFKLLLNTKIEEEKSLHKYDRIDIEQLRLANNLRKDYSMVVYNIYNPETGITSTVAASAGEKGELKVIDKVPSKEELSTFLTEQKGDSSLASNLDIYEQHFHSLFEDGIVDEIRLLLLCGYISSYIKLGDIYLEGNTIKALGIPYLDYRTLLSELPALVSMESRKKLRKGLEELASLALQYEFIQNDKAVVLDGVAYIAESNAAMLGKPTRYYIEGYLNNGKVIWTYVDQTKFKKIEVETDAFKEKDKVKEILLLETLFYSSLYTVYRSVLKDELVKVIQSPYPVAILEDGVYAFYFETKEDNEEAVTFDLNKWFKGSVIGANNLLRKSKIST